jgi:hypothetical protein
MKVKKAVEGMILNLAMNAKSRLICLLLLDPQTQIRHAACECSHDFRPSEKRQAIGIAPL